MNINFSLPAPFSTWHLRTVFEAINYEPLAWFTIISAAGIVFWYSLIVFLALIPAAKSATPETEKAIYSVSILILLCAIAGAGTTFLSGWFPNLAYLIRMILLIAQNLIAPWLILSKRFAYLKSIGGEQKIGANLLLKYKEKKYNDIELGLIARELLAQKIESESIKAGFLDKDGVARNNTNL